MSFATFDETSPSSQSQTRISLRRNVHFLDSVADMDLPRALIHIERANSGEAYHSPISEVADAYDVLLQLATNHNGALELVRDKHTQILGTLGPIDSLLQIRKLVGIRYWRSACTKNGVPTDEEIRQNMLQPLKPEEAEAEIPTPHTIEESIREWTTANRVVGRCDAILASQHREQSTGGTHIRDAISTSMEIFIANEIARMAHNSQPESDIPQIRARFDALLEKYAPAQEELSKAA